MDCSGKTTSCLRKQHLGLAHWNQCQYTKRNFRFIWGDIMFLKFYFDHHPKLGCGSHVYSVLWLSKGRKDYSLDYLLPFFVLFPLYYSIIQKNQSCERGGSVLVSMTMLLWRSQRLESSSVAWLCPRSTFAAICCLFLF